MKKLVVAAMLMAAPMVSFAGTSEVGKSLFENPEAFEEVTCSRKINGINYTVRGTGNSVIEAADNCRAKLDSIAGITAIRKANKLIN